jgi:hypothetical protein
VINKADVKAATDIIRSNVQAGVKVSIVLREDIANDPDVPKIEDMSLVTDHSGFTGVLRPEGPAGPDLFTAEERQVAYAEDLLRSMEPYARGVDDVFGS